MNKQRKVLITITYNEMGIIIDTKAEEVAQPNLQPTCNQLATTERDLISRQAVLNKIKKVCFSREQEWVDFRVSQGSNGQRDLIINFIEDLPPVNPQQKTGHWIYKQYGSYPEQGDYHCSECDGIDNRIPAYCPNCGAKMIEPQERSDKE